MISTVYILVALLASSTNDVIAKPIPEATPPAKLSKSKSLPQSRSLARSTSSGRTNPSGLGRTQSLPNSRSLPRSGSLSRSSSSGGRKLSNLGRSQSLPGNHLVQLPSTYNKPGGTTSSSALPPLKGTKIIEFKLGGGTPHIIINFGEQKKPMTVMFDTGSDDTWVRSSLCTARENCEQIDKNLAVPARYKVLEGYQHDMEKSDHGVAYGSGTEVKCVAAVVGVGIAGIDLPQQKICLARQIEADSLLEEDGIAGVGRHDKTPTNMFGPLMNRYPASNRIIGVWYNPAHISSGTELLKTPKMLPNGGQLSIGGVDASKIAGNVYWVKLMDVFHDWSVNIKSITLKDFAAEGSELKLQSPNKQPKVYSLIDTGCTMTYLIPELANPIIKEVQKTLPKSLYKDDMLIFFCSDAKLLGSLVMELDTVTLEIPREFLYTHVKDTHCMLNIGVHEDPDYNIIGGTILRAFYTAFDFQNGKIGFGNLKAGAFKGTVKSSSWSLPSLVKNTVQRIKSKKSKK